mgnify:CR=1 FL=1
MSKAHWKPHPNAIARDGSISPNAHRVWSVIRSHENKQGEAHLGNETIAKESKMTVRSVQRAKVELTKKEMLITTYTTKEGCLKRPTKEKAKHGEPTLAEILVFEVTDAWEKRQHQKHTCHGCGSCHECRTAESKYQQELRDFGF